TENGPALDSLVPPLHPGRTSGMNIRVKGCQSRVPRQPDQVHFLDAKVFAQCLKREPRGRLAEPGIKLGSPLDVPRSPGAWPAAGSPRRTGEVPVARPDRGHSPVGPNRFRPLPG